MKKNRGVIQSGNFYADHIYACRRKDKKAIEDFFISVPEGQGLSAYFKGIGNVLFTELIVPLINRAANHIGIKAVYLFSLPYTKLMARYESYGFKRLSVPKEVRLHRRLKPRYDKSCNFMYMILDSKKNGIKKRS